MENLREKTRIIGKRKNFEDIELVNVESTPVQKVQHTVLKKSNSSDNLV